MRGVRLWEPGWKRAAAANDDGGPSGIRFTASLAHWVTSREDSEGQLVSFARCGVDVLVSVLASVKDADNADFRSSARAAGSGHLDEPALLLKVDDAMKHGVVVRSRDGERSSRDGGERAAGSGR